MDKYRSFGLMGSALLILAGVLLISVACTLDGGGVFITPTGQVEITSTIDETVTPTVVITNTPRATATPNSTVTPSVTPTNTPQPTTVVPTPTPIVPPVFCQIPCGPNHLFNEGFESNYAPMSQEHGNIVLPESWSFEWQTGISPRNNNEPLDVPETGDIRGEFYPYRVDGYSSTNLRAFRWFKSWGVSRSGPTQSLALLEGHTYTLGASVSTWATNDPNLTQHFSQTFSDTDKSNIIWEILINFNNGPVLQGMVLKTFGYEDGVYDFVDNGDGTFSYHNPIMVTFSTPNQPNDGNDTINVNVGFIASNFWRFGVTDYHIDNAFLYCLDCGFSNGTPAAPPEEDVTVSIYQLENPTEVVVISPVLNIRHGANSLAPRSVNADGTNKQAFNGDRFLIIDVYEKSNGEVWARISENEWIAVLHPTCTKIAADDSIGTCSLFEEIINPNAPGR